MALCLKFLVAALAGQSAAHFLLNYPATVGFDEDLEGIAPCGGQTLDFSKNNVTDYHVSGDSLSMTSTHPTTTWLFRGTLDQKATGNWTDLSPAVAQSGLGDFCESSLPVPSSWAGQKGVIQIAADSPDGILYQCAAVNFVDGTGTPPSNCKNASSVSVTTTQDPSLSSLPASATSTPSSSSTKNAAPSNIPSGYTGVGPVMWIGSVILATFVAYLF